MFYDHAEAVRLVQEVEVLRQQIAREDARHHGEHYRLVEAFRAAVTEQNNFLVNHWDDPAFVEQLKQNLDVLGIVMGGDLTTPERKKVELALAQHDRRRVSQYHPAKEKKHKPLFFRMFRGVDRVY